jgi:hypothetical protein
MKFRFIRSSLAGEELRTVKVRGSVVSERRRVRIDPYGSWVCWRNTSIEQGRSALSVAVSV